MQAKVNATVMAITRARADSVITAAEVAKIEKSAGKSISNFEAQLIGNLFEDRISNIPMWPGMRVPMAFPGRPEVGFEATQKFNQLFVSRNLPYGERADSMRDQINKFLMVALIDAGTTKKPNIDHLPRLDLHPDMNDGPRTIALIDVRKKEYWLENHPGGNLPPGVVAPPVTWNGPFKLPKPEKVRTTLTTERKGEIQASFDAAKANASWAIGSPMANTRVVEMPLKSTDEYKYTALVAVGPTDPTPALDPNKVDEYFVVRMPKVIPPNARIAPEYAGPFNV